AGLLQDVGKYSKAFQVYLKTACNPNASIAQSAISTDHSTAGAQYVAKQGGMLGLLLAYVIAGHHGGLPNGIAAEKSLRKRLTKKVEPWQRESVMPSMLEGKPVPSPCPLLKAALSEPDAFGLAFFVRMLFSTLTDADFLDTEAFMDSRRHAERGTHAPSVLMRIERALDYRAERFGKPRTAVDRQRAAVRKACLDAASLSPGLFSLTVPTGGGKTLSSLAFALRHAQQYKKRRIVYVIPFTSIVEQTADVFRDVVAELDPELAESAILEHHSNFDPERETLQSRLATENWDAPLIVTTAVQFYESLFGNRSSTCRKLHNLADSVIILDEAQCLPVDLLTPCLVALREMVDCYGATIVLCTATQPAVKKREGFQNGLDNVREIIPEPGALYRNLKRVEVENAGPLSDDELVDELTKQPQGLCIVNTRGHAAELYRRLTDECGDSASFHLSANMCPAHRQKTLAQIFERLEANLACRVISTQVIEAGVDIDFPVVFRSMAGVDSIAQAAGRCNRNGTLESGRVVVFQSEHPRAERFVADTANCGRQILELYPEPLDMDAVDHYFRLYYWDQVSRWDARKVMDCFRLDRGSRQFPFLFDFAEAAQRFRLIDDQQEAVLVPYDEEAQKLCERLRYSETIGRDVLRRLQRYAVSVRRRTWQQHVGKEIELLRERFAVLVSPEMNYSQKTGLELESAGPALMEA
ncbi:MAG: CRISPR-associated helicase Cas3', partial [Verrucomicrobiota bacterium]